jgi:hypothetical protein
VNPLAHFRILQRERYNTPVETASRRRVAFKWLALPHVDTSGNLAPNFNNLDLKPLFSKLRITDKSEIRFIIE